MINPSPYVINLIGQQNPEATQDKYLQTIYPCNFSYFIKQASVLLKCMKSSLLVRNNVFIGLNNTTSMFLKSPKNLTSFLVLQTPFSTCRVCLYS